LSWNSPKKHGFHEKSPKIGALRGLRTKAYYTKRILMVFPPSGCLFHQIPPIPCHFHENHHFGDFHGNDMEWVGFDEKGSPKVEIP
jgi:hypothetical protein